MSEVIISRERKEKMTLNELLSFMKEKGYNTLKLRPTVLIPKTNLDFEFELTHEEQIDKQKISGNTYLIKTHLEMALQYTKCATSKDTKIHNSIVNALRQL